MFTSEFSRSMSKHIGLTSSILSGRSTIEFIDESTNSGAILEKIYNQHPPLNNSSTIFTKRSKGMIIIYNFAITYLFLHNSSLTYGYLYLPRKLE